MALNKVGSPEKIKLVKMGALSFDPNLIVQKIKETWKQPSITKDQLHEAVKSIGIVNYNPEDIAQVINLLNSSGVTVQNSLKV
jgi:diketogulonate reductase-like aldo/keto reductase